MTPKNKDEAIDVLTALWKGRPEEVYGRAIIDYLSGHLDAKHIPFSDFFSIATDGRRPEQAVVLNIVNYLSGAQLHLLAKGFEYIDDDFVTEIDSQQARAAYDSSINPLTGQFDEAVKKKIFVYFVPSDTAKDLLRGAR